MAGRGRGMVLPAWMTQQQEEKNLGPGSSLPVSQHHEQAPSMSIQDHYAYSRSSTAPVAAVAEFKDDRGRGASDRRVEREDRPRERDTRDRDVREREREPRERESRDRDYRDRDRERDVRRRSRSRDRPPSRPPAVMELESRPTRSMEPQGSSSSKDWRARKEARRSNFDIPPPPGSDGMPAAGFPISCMATLPSHLVNSAGGSLAFPSVPLGATSAALAQTKNARRLYVGGIPPGTDEQEVSRFFNDTIIKATGGTEGACPVLSVYINQEKHFAFVEVNSVELCTACCVLDGMEYRGRLGTAVIRVRRPNDFRPELLPPPTRPLPVLNFGGVKMVSTTVSDGPNKIYVGNIPAGLGEEVIRELLEAFGPLKAFHMPKDIVTGAARGYCFCEYGDSSVTPKACEGLNGLEVGDKALIVQLHSSINSRDLPALAQGKEPTRVILLTSMITKEELIDVSEYEDIQDDIRHECSQYGQVTSLIIPRSIDGYSERCEGSVFVEFATKDMAKIAASALSGRKFADRTVIVDFFDEEKYSRRILI